MQGYLIGRPQPIDRYRGIVGPAAERAQYVAVLK
jgi:hypothetical protein